MEKLAIISGACTVLFSLWALGRTRGRRVECPSPGSGASNLSGPGFALSAAGLTSAAVCGFVLVYLLCVRFVIRLLELRSGTPHLAMGGAAGEAHVFLVLGGLALVCVAFLSATGDRRFVTPLFWLIVLAGTWAAVLSPAIRSDVDDARDDRTGAAFLTLWWCVTVCGFLFTQSWLTERSRRRAARTEPDRLLGDFESWPGIRASAGVLGIGVILLSFFQMAATPLVAPFGHPGSAGVMAVATMSCAVSMFLLVRRRWSRNLSEIGMGCTTVAAVAGCVMLVPAHSGEMGARFPMVLNAIMIGLALSAWCWLKVFGIWSQQLDEGGSWTAAGRMISCADRFCLYVGFLGLALGSLLAVWPRLRSVGAPDDSLSRLVVGVAGHLLLILVLLRSKRVTERAGFNVLAVVCMFSLFLFVAVRAMPFASVVYTGME